MSLRDKILNPYYPDVNPYADVDEDLTFFAKQNRPRIRCWLSLLSGPFRRIYYCNICEMEVDRESGQFPPTRHAIENVGIHRDAHSEQLVKYGRPTKFKTEDKFLSDDQ